MCLLLLLQKDVSLVCWGNIEVLKLILRFSNQIGDKQGMVSKTSHRLINQLTNINQIKSFITNVSNRNAFPTR